MDKGEISRKLQKNGIPNIAIYKTAILEALEDGYKLTDIHKLLVDDYNLHLSYEGLRHNVNKWKKKDRQKKPLDEVFARTRKDSKSTPNKTADPKQYKKAQKPLTDKNANVFDNWTGENLSNKELYGVE